jgi:hypothetical protein
VPLGQNHARPRCTVALGPRPRRRLGPRAQRRAWPTATRGAAHVRSARPALAGPTSARDGAAHVGEVTAPGRASRHGWRQRHSGGGGANGGGRAPTTLRLPAGHGGGGDSSPELLVDGEGEKTGSAVAFFRRGGATVAGGGPVTARREGKVSSMLHGRRTARGELERRSPWTCSRRWRRSGRSDSEGRLRTGRRRGRDERCWDGRCEAVRTAAAARSERRCRDAGARSRQRF